MKKKVAKFSVLPIIAAFMFFSFSTRKAANLDKYATSADEILEYTVTSVEDSAAMGVSSLDVVPELGKSYIGFKEAVGFKESRGDYNVVNEFGYMGKYQFGKGTLRVIGIYDTQKFLNSPQLQEAAFYANAARNKWILIRDIERFVGKYINGIEITESGILAAAHLAGPGSVKKYLRSLGSNGFSDAFGTSIGFYMKRFAGYDTSFVQPDKNAKVDLNRA